jgi:branched-chain amino acid aminotransferase
MPPYEVFIEGIKKLIQLDSRWVPDLPNTSLYIRPTLIGTEAFLGVRPSDKYLFFVILSPCGNYFGNDRPVEIWVEESYIRAAPGGLGSTKAAANYAASLKAAHEAKKKGFSQVLWLDVTHKYVEEVGTMNVFFAFKDEVVTPSLEGTILGGGTRDSVIQILKHKGIKINERRITIDEIISGIQSGHLTEAFGTGTAAVISPIGALSYKNQKYIINNNQNGPLSLELRSTISNIQLGNQKDTYGWTHPV